LTHKLVIEDIESSCDMLLIDVFKDLFEDLLEDLLEKPKLQNIPLNKVVSTFLVLYLLELKDSA